MRNIAITAVIGLAMSCSASAGVIYDNLSAASSAPDALAIDGPLFNSFTTPTAGALSGLQLLLFDSYPPDGYSISVALFADSSATPGGLITPLGSIDDSALSGSLSAIQVNLGSNPLLAASTRYWIGLESSGFAGWGYSSNTSGVGVASEYYSFHLGTRPNSCCGGPYQMQVTVGGATPEPATGALGAAALAAMVFLARRRRAA
jgi:MYXO-CTERM domain-containing protein